MERRAAHGKPRGAALLLHAMMVDRRSMDRPPESGFGSRLAEHGFEVFLADFRGRGLSGPSVSKGGRWGYDDLVRYDVPAFVRAVRAQSPGLPVVVVGHSLGGHVTVASVAAGTCMPPPDAIVGLSANVWMPGLETSLPRKMAKAASMAAFLAATRRHGRFPSREVGMGPVEEAAPYVEDLCRFWRTDRWESRDRIDDYLAGMGRVRVPMLSVIGRADRLMAHPAGAAGWARRVGAEGATTWLLGREDFGLTHDPGHMDLVTDVRSRPAWDAIAAWMVATARKIREAATPPPPPRGS
jgi:predicted alpha/beta hydrolase